MTLREGLEKLRDDLSEQLSDPDCVHGAGEYAFQRLDALLSTADSEQREAVALRKAQRALLDNLETVDVQARTVTLTVSTVLWENWQDDTRHHPDTRPGEQREVADVALISAHRCCLAGEHDPEHGKIHGYCVVCGVPWPCVYADPSDLRRKLDEANLENGRLLNDRKVFMQMLNESERERAASSLTIAALRTALEDAIKRMPVGVERMKARSALADSPADSLVQEVVKVLSAARGMAHRHHIYDECQECGMLRGSIDAVLARIGGKT